MIFKCRLFAVGVTREFKKAVLEVKEEDWKPIYKTTQNRAEGKDPSGLEMEQLQYKVFGTVTNMDWDGEELIHWQRKRCGKSEEVHSVMKEDLAGGKFPSGDFGENAAWWWMMVLALNLNQTMKRLVLGKNWVSKRRNHLDKREERLIFNCTDNNKKKKAKLCLKTDHKHVFAAHERPKRIQTPFCFSKIQKFF